MSTGGLVLVPDPEKQAQAIDYELHFGQGHIREYANYITFFPLHVRANVRAGRPTPDPAEDFSPLKGPREAPLWGPPELGLEHV